MARSTGEKLLTDTAIRNWLKKPKGAALHDGGGLYLRHRGESAYWALRQVNPQTKARTWAALFVNPSLPYPQATLIEARRRAAEAKLRESAEQGDLVRLREADRARRAAEAAAAELEASRNVTVQQLFTRWAGTDLAPRTRADGTREGRKDGGEYTRQQFERRVFPTLGDKPARSITKGDLMALLDSIKAEGKLRTANVLLADLKQMFQFALVRELVDRNPLDTVTRRQVGGKETARDRTLSPDEITALAAALPRANMSRRSVCAVWLILATGCRVSEAMGAEWSHIDTVARTWHLPETKNERDHTIHLSDFALRQIGALAELRESDKDGKPLPWVFPNAAGDGPVCIKSFGKQLSDRQRPPEKRMQHRSKATGSLMLAGGKWTAHDLRRTAATLMAHLGISADVIDECLNHVIESRVRRTYIRDRRLPEQARAFDALGSRLAALVDGTTNVVKLRAA